MDLGVPILKYYKWLIDGWMTCHFTSFSTVFQSYQDDWWVILNGVSNGTPFTVFASSGLLDQ